MKRQTIVVRGLALVLAVVPPVLAFWTQEYWHPAAWKDACRLAFNVLVLCWLCIVVVSLFAYLAEEDRHD